MPWPCCCLSVTLYIIVAILVIVKYILLDIVITWVSVVSQVSVAMNI